MAKIIEFYVPTNFHKPGAKWTPSEGDPVRLPTEEVSVTS